jgi:hypothetical protein
MTGTGAYPPIHNKEAKCCHNRIGTTKGADGLLCQGLPGHFSRSIQHDRNRGVTGCGLNNHAAYLVSTEV